LIRFRPDRLERASSEKRAESRGTGALSIKRSHGRR
jgi:hypothetical protein